MLFTFSEQEIDLLNFNHSSDLLFPMTGKFYPWTWICKYVVFWTGACFESRFYWTLRICKQVKGSLSGIIYGLKILLTAYRQLYVSFCIVI